MRDHVPAGRTGTYRLGFDVGGTFTDFALVNSDTGDVRLGKCLTTPEDPSRGIADGLLQLMADSDIQAADLEVACHATTLITNALIERKGAVTALVTTEGFRDTLEMGTEVRYDNYELSLTMPAPLVPRYRRYDIRERIAADGRVVTPLDRDQLRAVAQEMLAARVEAVALVFLHSFTNPAHEIEAEAILRAEMPGVAISRSSLIAPEIREFERSSTTAANAYVQPIVSRYLDRAQGILSDSGYARPMQIMVSSGGVAGVDLVKAQPIRSLESGPAAGVLAAIHFSRLLGIPDLITFDMGGTTAKVGLIRGHEARKGNTFEFGRVARMIRGSGLPVKIPFIELIEIGAGGGSIASTDKLGLLQVGPHSAGSRPGPACYGRGGEQPTVTDANLLLGYLNPDYFLGGEMLLSRSAAIRAMSALSEPLNLSVAELAQGMSRIVNQNMVSASKVHIAEQGEDPQKFFLFAFGGAGPVHAWDVARQMGMKGVIVPPAAGAGSALGLVVSPISFDTSRSLPCRLDRLQWPDLARVLDAMLDEARAVMRDAGLSEPEVVAAVPRFEMDMRHFGQGREITVPIDPAHIAAASIEGLAAAFYAAHQDRFGHVHRDLTPELVTCRLSLSGQALSMPVAPGPDQAAGQTATPAPKAWREVYFAEIGTTQMTAIYQRQDLRPGMRFDGPAVIEERECTIVAGPGARIEVHPSHSLFMTPR